MTTEMHAIQTRKNTEFMDWWPLLNQALAGRKMLEAGYREARDAYDMGLDPERAARDMDDYYDAEEIQGDEDDGEA